MLLNQKTIEIILFSLNIKNEKLEYLFYCHFLNSFFLFFSQNKVFFFKNLNNRTSFYYVCYLSPDLSFFWQCNINVLITCFFFVFFCFVLFFFHLISFRKNEKQGR